MADGEFLTNLQCQLRVANAFKVCRDAKKAWLFMKGDERTLKSNKFLRLAQGVILYIRLEGLDLVSIGNRLTIIRDDTAERLNKNNLKKIITLCQELGFEMPECFIRFSKE